MVNQERILKGDCSSIWLQESSESWVANKGGHLCCWVGRAGQTSARPAGQQCTAIAAWASKRLAAATVNSSFFSSVEEPTQEKGELSVYLLPLQTTFLFQFLSPRANRNTPSCQLHGRLEPHHDHGLLRATMRGRCYFYYAYFHSICGSEMLSSLS